MSMAMLSGLCILASPSPISSLPSSRRVRVAAGVRVLDVGPAQEPEPTAVAIERTRRALAVVLATFGGQEVEVVGVVRVEVAVLDAVEAEAVPQGVGVLGGAGLVPFVVDDRTGAASPTS